MATDATANQPSATSSTTSASPVRIATPELVALSNKPLDIDIMADLIFENIGGQELINIARNDIINGQDVLYTPITNMQNIYLQYNPNNIVRLQDTADTYFKNFPIRFESKSPTVGTGPNGEIVYIDSTTGDLVINVYNLEPGEQVDVQILNSGDFLDGTIYGVE